jgi:prevent-host-death family protein
MPIIDIAAAQTQLPDLLAAASRGESVIISQDGKPVAELVAVRPPRKLREPGSMAGKIWIADDFDAPLPDDTQAAFEGR